MVGDDFPEMALDAQPSDEDGRVDRRASVVEQIRHVARSVQAAIADTAARAGLSQSDFQALARIVVNDGLSGAEVRQILGVTSSSISELADRLEQGGMIRRAQSPSDRRVVVLTATARGRQVVERALAPVLTAMAGVVNGLAEAELEVVSRFLSEVDRGLGAVSEQ